MDHAAAYAKARNYHLPRTAAPAADAMQRVEPDQTYIDPTDDTKVYVRNGSLHYSRQKATAEELATLRELPRGNRL